MHFTTVLPDLQRLFVNIEEFKAGVYRNYCLGGGGHSGEYVGYGICTLQPKGGPGVFPQKFLL